MNLKIVKIYFHLPPPLWFILVSKIPQFGQKLPIRTAHHSFLESKHPEVTKNLYYVLSTRQSQIPIFLGSSSWTIFIVIIFFICINIKMNFLMFVVLMVVGLVIIAANKKTCYYVFCCCYCCCYFCCRYYYCFYCSYHFDLGYYYLGDFVSHCD